MAKEKPRRQWTYAHRTPSPLPVPDDLNAEVEARANEHVERHMKPRCIKPPPKDRR